MSDALRNLLFDTAQEMIEEGDDKKTIKSNLGEGEIKTKNEQVCVGGFIGTIFIADLDTPRGSFRSAFVVRPNRKFRSKDGNWVPIHHL
jgi:hypothetical protein